ncbi:caspase family protein [Leptolyngbya boryana CZ1]|uniref:Caspase family protein n=1 Tax=Leptolyngbya boryana CZ1 TaxID=3060204 RepID=A0AA96WQG2_LEPBY|nr:caspase family protein [Leptolyngbya boryana]WNZ44055.1 caspase family protein [Leptolyngbya boryana CZ1]
MSSLKRRQFLQFAGSTLATLGLSQHDFFRQADRYGRVLAQDNPRRKLALLVGIEYANDPKVSPLPGCITDLELQWHLLVHRFGFNPKDIYVLADRQPNFLDRPPLPPTRENIFQAFNEYLIRQAKSDDTVVFHFSGHGGLVLDERSKTRLFTVKNRTVDGTILPSDHYSNADPKRVQDIMGRSIFLLTDQLQTDTVSIILDSCHSGAGTRGGNLIYRVAGSRTSEELDRPTDAELQYQEQKLREKNLDELDFAKLREKNAKGIAIGSANYTELAMDQKFDNDRFRAGAFTYLLTRYLWQMPTDESLNQMFDKLRMATAIASVDQVPEYLVNPDRAAKQPIYFVNTQTPWADAVIRKISDNSEIEFWLGGISAFSLEQNSKGSIFSVINVDQQEVAQITQTRRDRLFGYGTLTSGSKDAIKPGALLREVIQGIDPKPVLKLSIDDSLGKDKADAQTALEQLSFVKLVPISQASYVLGRMTLQYQTQSKQQKFPFIPNLNQIGLFTADGLRPVENSFRSEGTIEKIISGLSQNLKSVLAKQILKTITGEDIATQNPKFNIKTEILTLEGKALGGTNIKRFQEKSLVQLQLTNRDRTNLYAAVIAINSDSTLSFLHPSSADASESAALVEQGTSVKTVEVKLLPPAGFVEVLTIASTSPIRKALLALQRVAIDNRLTNGRSAIPTSGDASLNVIGDLLADLDQNTRRSIAVIPSVSGVNKTQFSSSTMIVEVVQAQ